MAGRLAGMEIATLLRPGVREHGVRRLGIAGIFLDAEIGRPQIDVSIDPHRDRRNVHRTVTAGAHVMDRGEIEDAAEPGDAAGVDRRDADIVDQLLLDELFAVPDGVEHLADGDRGGRMLPDQAETVLPFCRHRVFQPE